MLGSGAAGSSAAKNLQKAGWSVTLVDRGRWGGACLWTACIPKKALYHCARVARETKAAEQFGVACGSIEIDWQSMLAWKWHAQETYAGDQKALLTAKGMRLIEGDARFTAVDEIEVAGERLHFDHAVIATGSRPVMPNVSGIELADTSEDALRYPDLPSSLAIVGGGFIALEMAGIFASLGTRVSVIERGSRILEMLDDELALTAHRRLQAMGVDFFTGATLSAIEGERGALRVEFADPSGALHAVEADRALVATGRKPDFSALDLGNADIALDDAGHLVLDPHSRTTNPNVWACGDAAGGMMQTPIANYEGRVVANAIDSGHPGHAECAAIPVCCFTVPQLATVGLTAAAADAAGHEVRVSRVQFDFLGEAIIEDVRDSFVKIIADKADGAILGAQIAAPNASDLIYAATLAVRTRMTLAQLGEAIAVHPSLAEGIYWAGE